MFFKLLNHKTAYSSANFLLQTALYHKISESKKNIFSKFKIFEIKNYHDIKTANYEL